MLSTRERCRRRLESENEKRMRESTNMCSLVRSRRTNCLIRKPLMMSTKLKELAVELGKEKTENETLRSRIRQLESALQTINVIAGGQEPLRSDHGE